MFGIKRKEHVPCRLADEFRWEHFVALATHPIHLCGGPREQPGIVELAVS
jgi:hypothetical protein